MTEKKTINLNKEYLNLQSSSNTTFKKKSGQLRIGKEKPQNINIKPNQLKQKLLEKIKNYQHSNANNANNANNATNATNATNEIKLLEQDFNNEFNKSLNFLQDLSLKPKVEKKLKINKKTLKNKLIVSTELPPDLCINTTAMQMPNAPMQIHNAPMQMPNAPMQMPNAPMQMPNAPMQMPNAPMQMPNAPMQMHSGLPEPILILKEPPLYSNLKNGSKPTYRQFHNKTLKNNTVTPLVVNTTPLIVNTTNAQPNAQPNAEPNAQPNAQELPLETIIRKRITRTLKYKLGKRGNKVSILIKNGKTRKLVQHEQALLKGKNILDVKNYLRKKNLLKIGSESPPDVLRQIYENSILAGDVDNKSSENLVHNYMHDK